VLYCGVENAKKCIVRYLNYRLKCSTAFFEEGNWNKTISLWDNVAWISSTSIYVLPHECQHMKSFPSKNAI